MTDEAPGGGRLSDRLALERTELASERTMLAWLRTGLGAGIAGATLLRFGGKSPLDRPLALVLIVLGALAVTTGVLRRAKASARYAAWWRDLGGPPAR